MINSETKTHSASSVRACQSCHSEFVIEPEDFAFYEKMKVPPPTWCPECRARRRFVWRGEHALFKRKSDYSGNLIFSGISPEAPVKIYENDIYYSDKWDPMEFGQEVDFSKPFLEQLVDLLHNVPLPARSVARSANSDYSNWITAVKNGYLIFNTTENENSAYGNAVNYSKDCVDNSHLNKCELSYEGFWLSRCSKAYFSSQCEDCVDIYFCKNLYGCSNCFGSINLRNKKYYIWNKPYSPQEYFKTIDGFNLGSRKSLDNLREKAKAFHLKFPNKFMEGTKNTNVSGEYISNSKNIYNSYLVKEGENLHHCQYMAVPPNKDCYDHTVFGDNNELTYECAICGLGLQRSKFCWWCFSNAHDIQYCFACGSSSDLFGCVSLRKKQYCILNKQYTKEEYEALVSKIIEHMNDMPYVDKKGRVYKYGEFFPTDMSPFAYNETIAQEHWPLTKEKAAEQGHSWRDFEERNYSVTLTADKIPDNSKEFSETILDEVLECSHKGRCSHQCKKAFKIVQQEFQFYKKMNLPLPHLCPNCRREERLKQRQKFKFYHRVCMCDKLSHGHDGKCPNEFETSYVPDRPEMVYCESCYQKEIY